MDDTRSRDKARFSGLEEVPFAEAEKRPILIAEDDKKTASLLAQYLEREGFRTIRSADGEEALANARRHELALIILDLMLPRIDGWQLCRMLRRESDVPILILTAREKEMDRLMGLSLGADDYVTKPFSPREVVARVKAILRRTTPRERFRYRNLELDARKRQVSLEGRPVALTPSEFKLLHVLMREPGKAFSREELLQQLYPHGEAVVERVVDVHIGKLRQKIEPEPASPRYVLTARGFGYRFADREE